MDFSPQSWPGRERTADFVIELASNAFMAAFRGVTLALGEWYELRVAGSAGTQEGAASGIKEGIAVGEDGRICSLSSGRARKFESRQQALDYLGKIKVSGDYQFEAVRCGVRAAA